MARCVALKPCLHVPHTPLLLSSSRPAPYLRLQAAPSSPCLDTQVGRARMATCYKTFEEAISSFCAKNMTPFTPTIVKNYSHLPSAANSSLCLSALSSILRVSSSFLASRLSSRAADASLVVSAALERRALISSSSASTIVYKAKSCNKKCD